MHQQKVKQYLKQKLKNDPTRHPPPLVIFPIKREIPRRYSLPYPSNNFVRVDTCCYLGNRIA